MEPGVKQYLQRILNTISVWLVWMTVNSTLGIRYQFAYIDKGVTAGNIIFYSWLVLSLVVFVWWVIRVWSKPIDYDA
ncbi:MAG: hypothetical protein M0Q26_10225 [Chitinophagaceae bacterium]|nr:hypothetical protein [Chitinophagaceae bacterium]MDP1763087.1 hypothetical protein [Sediminibacterium sp.]MDP1811010.1 hypothetical protein [Sediminibacterium sp.]MDP3128206.1 hypothetical protein [Sediminibacterium sp.]MDP3665294.1 hypothetical protein [Sediminibacterium sp.]